MEASTLDKYKLKKCLLIFLWVNDIWVDLLVNKMLKKYENVQCLHEQYRLQIATLRYMWN